MSNVQLANWPLTRLVTCMWRKIKSYCSKDFSFLLRSSKMKEKEMQRGMFLRLLVLCKIFNVQLGPIEIFPWSRFSKKKIFPWSRIFFLLCMPIESRNQYICNMAIYIYIKRASDFLFCSFIYSCALFFCFVLLCWQWHTFYFAFLLITTTINLTFLSFYRG